VLLAETDLSRVNLTQAILRNARYSAATVWPDDIDPEANGTVLDGVACLPANRLYRAYTEPLGPGSIGM